MLTIVIPEQDLFDERTNSFIPIRKQKLQLEHSLVSISKWESKWHKPFLGKDKKTTEETIDYVRCMTITQNVDPIVYLGLTSDNIRDINAYIDNPMTATWFNKDDQKKKNNSGEVVTSELIYYWMIALQIPPEYQKWHLNRLLTLIQVCNIKNQPAKKMRRQDILARNRSLNEARKAKYHTKG